PAMERAQPASRSYRLPQVHQQRNRQPKPIRSAAGAPDSLWYCTLIRRHPMYHRLDLHLVRRRTDRGRYRRQAPHLLERPSPRGIWLRVVNWQRTPIKSWNAWKRRWHGCAVSPPRLTPS
ncbi:MAG: hypothetical protein KDI73_10475, partial [Candidatus Competibacteraceae bacterium]|nr:hypothetical protein [Candidatus Competibacteraceae bacterium]